MAIISEDFDRFLEANYPDDWMKASVPDVKQDVINYIYSKTNSKYEVWKKIPEWIKAMFSDKLPEEVLRGNEPWDNFILHLEKSNYDYNKVASIVYNTVIKSEENVRYCNNVVDSGYSFECAVYLTEIYDERKRLWDSGELKTPEGKKKWRKLGEKKLAVMEQDLREYRPERWVLRQLRLYDRNIRKSKMAKTEEERKKHMKNALENRKQYTKYIKLVENRELRRRLERLNKYIMDNHERLENLSEIKKVEEYMKKDASRATARRINSNNIDAIRSMVSQMRK